MKFEQQQQEIGELIERGKFSDAKLKLVDCLNHEPNSLPAYHLFGRLFEKLDAGEVARECFLGRLPSSIQTEDFSFNAEMAVEASSHVSHEVSHESVKQPCSSVSLQNHPVTRRYSTRPLISKPSGLYRMDSARLWYDGMNTVVFDKDERIVKSISSENIAPVFNAANQQSPTEITGQVVLIGAQGSNNYYHWMADVIPKFEILKKCGVELSEKTKYVFTNVTQAFQHETLALLNIKPNQIIQTWKQGSLISAEELIIPYIHNDMGLSMGAWLPEAVKAAFLKGSSTIPKLLLSRDPNRSHGRGVSNVKAFNELYLSKGYQLVLPEEHTVQEQAALFAGAESIVAIHGAGLANLLFCREGTEVLELFGPHFAPCYWAISEISHLQYRNVHCVSDQPATGAGSSQIEQAKSLGARRSASFSVPLELL